MAVLIRPGLDPRLSGAEPFPKLQDWRADGALFAYQALKARLLDDPVGYDVVDSIRALSPEEWTRTLLRPEVFAFIGNQPTRWEWADLRSALEVHSVRDAGGTGVAVSPSAQFLRILRESGIGSRRQDSSAANFLDPAGAEYARWNESIAEASRLIARIVPGFAADLAAAVDQVALIDRGASFRGSSGVIHRGMIFLSPEDDWGVGVVAEELIHEATHNLLDLVSLRRPLIVGDDIYEEKFAAPFRPDKRHLYGNFHAVVVVSRLIRFFLAVAEDSEVGGEMDWVARARDYAHSSMEPLESVAAHGGLSPLARQLVDRMVSPTIQAAAEM